ncbi:MAG: hypothetical protein KGQ48_08270 [Bradyrhizobium sp.]|nr:hypothetical protein [Bradyrhizobium sp.]
MPNWHGASTRQVGCDHRNQAAPAELRKYDIWDVVRRREFHVDATGPDDPVAPDLFQPGGGRHRIRVTKENLIPGNQGRLISLDGFSRCLPRYLRIGQPGAAGSGWTIPMRAANQMPLAGSPPPHATISDGEN